PEYSGKGRLSVIAHSGKRFGLFEKRIEVSGDLVFESSLPLALAPGDKFKGTLRIFANEGAGPAIGSVTLKTLGPATVAGVRLPESGDLALAVDGDGNRRIDFALAPGGDRTIFFDAVAVPREPVDASGVASPTVGRASLVLAVAPSTGDPFELVKNTVVRPPWPKSTRFFEKRTEGPETSFELSDLAAGLLPGTVEATVDLTPGPDLSLREAFDYLRDYPHGCLEQVVSRAMIFLAADSMGVNLPLTMRQSAEQGILAAVAIVASDQLLTGGFSMWPGAREEWLWGTVHATHFLTLAKEKVKIPGTLLEDALERIRAYLSMTPGGGETGDARYLLAVKAYALYVLRLNGIRETAWVNSLADRERGLAPSGRLFLAGTAALSEGNGRALRELEEKNPDMTLDTNGLYRSSLESPARNLALKLLLWTDADPLSVDARLAYLELLGKIDRGFLGNTQENGFALLALSRYLRKTRSGTPYEARILSPAGDLLARADEKSPASLAPATLRPHFPGPFAIELSGEGRPYFSVAVSGVPLEGPEPFSEGLTLSKSVSIDGGEEIRFSPGSGANLVLKSGDSVRVFVRVSGSVDVQNVVVSDLFPGGLESDGFDADDDRAGRDDYDRGDIRVEEREDRVVVVIPGLFAGETRDFSYSLRAVSEGEFAIPPLGAEGMYAPGVKALVPGGTLTVSGGEG
ncbi:MAG: hypothetical protein LBF41_09430, partial [Deltaproteobacteria bacterium]|nr:hypothetical protein [Deltaproteobacteria bacterium]